VHTVLLAAKNGSDVNVQQIQMNDNGNLNLPITFSMAQGSQAFYLSNISFNLASKSTAFLVSRPDKMEFAFITIFGNGPGTIFERERWSQSSEHLKFVNIVENTAPSVFFGDVFGSAASLIVVRNSLELFANISDQGILTVSDSIFDYHRLSKVLKVGEVNSPVRYDNCEFQVAGIPRDANNFAWKKVCFMISDARYPFPPQAFFDEVMNSFNSNPHLFGAIVVTITMALVVGIVVYRRSFTYKYGGMPIGLAQGLMQIEKAENPTESNIET
jgi:hypothetical protein